MDSNKTKTSLTNILEERQRLENDQKKWHKEEENLNHEIHCFLKSSQIHDKEECLSKKSSRTEQSKLQEQWRQIHNSRRRYTCAKQNEKLKLQYPCGKQELGTPLVSTLTLEEQRQTQDMESEKMELFSKLQAIHSDKMSLEQQLASLNAEVDEYLYRKIASLRLEIQKLKQNDSDEMNDNWLHPSIATKEDIEAEHRSLLSELSSIKKMK
ncbi:Structural maintenance of chromosomes protein 3 [Galdieria sulphuraria]|nr:Structural maintenance of chromosomes protein 3 [Galdieria sulphuraria]